mgnify:CR=1 FL=1
MVTIDPGPSASVMLHALTGIPPVDIRIGHGVNSSYAFGMTADYVFLEDLPQADERVIRAHAAELVAMAEDLGLSDVRYASSNRIVVTRTDHVESLGVHKFSERASFLLGHQIRAYSDAVLKNPGVSPDLLAATPL